MIDPRMIILLGVIGLLDVRMFFISLIVLGVLAINWKDFLIPGGQSK